MNGGCPQKQTTFSLDEKVLKEDRETAEKELATQTALKVQSEQQVAVKINELHLLRETAANETADTTAHLEAALEREGALLKTQAHLAIEIADSTNVLDDLRSQLAAVDAVIDGILADFLPVQSELSATVAGLEAELYQLQAFIDVAPGIADGLQADIVRTQDSRIKAIKDREVAAENSLRLANSIKVTRDAISNALEARRITTATTNDTAEAMTNAKEAQRDHLKEQAAAIDLDKSAIRDLFRNNPAAAREFQQLHAAVGEQQQALAGHLQQRALLETEVSSLRDLLPSEWRTVRTIAAFEHAPQVASDAGALPAHLVPLLAALDTVAAQLNDTGGQAAAACIRAGYHHPDANEPVRSGNFRRGRINATPSSRTLQGNTPAARPPADTTVAEGKVN